MDYKFNKIEKQLGGIEESLVQLNNNVEKLNKKVDNLKKDVNGNLFDECKKMGDHIDFIENVYENVKHPLGYLCKKINYLTGTDRYALSDISGNNN